MSYRDILKAQLKIDEGVKNKLYRDSVGKWTIGCGHNIDDKGLPPQVIDLLLEMDMDDAEVTAKKLFPSFESLSDERKAVLTNMAFNLGEERLGAFRKFRRAILEENWDQAATEMLCSQWADQVGQRAVRLAKQMRTG